ncbi:MAG TPA: SPOR domain-containing protein [Gemmatimonadaceae bacterium]|nr:SPOR domain-containing protein [Gemmatimonadaceae bacterium]
MTKRVLVALVMAAASASAAGAQQRDSVRTPQDSAIARARQLADHGDDVGARRVIDSLFSATSPDSAGYADVLYWRATLAPAAADAERDYRRLLIEAPLSPRAESALLQLANLEQARGDRRNAADHLQRFLLSYPDSPERPRASVTLVRLLFDQGQVARGCEALRSGRETIPPANAELRNQLEFYTPRCALYEPVQAAGADSATRDSIRADTVAREAPRPPAPKPVTAPPSTARAQKSFYSVQVAAYDSQEPAARMAHSLVTRGLEARVDGKARPFRVRIGKYATRAEAAKAQATLKSQGFAGFVALVR